MKNPIIKAAEEAKKEIAKISKKTELEVKSINDQFQKEDDKIYSQIADLNQKKRELAYENSKKIKEIHTNAQDRIREIHPPIEKLDEIMLCLNIKNRLDDKEDFSLEFKTEHTERNKNKYLELVDTIVSDEYLNLKVLIYENDKPKNKFSLCFIGKSIFWDEKLIKYPNSYRLTISDWGTNIRGTLKEASTVEELKIWWSKNKEKDFWGNAQHKKIVELYKWVLENCQTDEWNLYYWRTELARYEDNYWLKHDRNKPEDKRGNGQLSDDYKSIIKKIEDLQIKMYPLPL